MAGSKRKRQRREASIEASSQTLENAIEELMGHSASKLTLSDQFQKVRLAIDDAVNCYIRKRSMLTTPQQHLGAAETLSRVLMNMARVDFAKIDTTENAVREAIRIEGFDPDSIIISAADTSEIDGGVQN